MASSTVRIYGNVINNLLQAQITALEQTAEALHTEVVQAQVMPRDTGTLQNTSTFIDRTRKSDGTVSLVSSTPYARRLYFHPEYNFSTLENPNAKGMWLEDWTTGSKKSFCRDAYAALYKQLTGV